MGDFWEKLDRLRMNHLQSDTARWVADRINTNHTCPVRGLVSFYGGPLVFERKKLLSVFLTVQEVATKEYLYHCLPQIHIDVSACQKFKITPVDPKYFFTCPCHDKLTAALADTITNYNFRFILKNWVSDRMIWHELVGDLNTLTVSAMKNKVDPLIDRLGVFANFSLEMDYMVEIFDSRKDVICDYLISECRKESNESGVIKRLEGLRTSNEICFFEASAEITELLDFWNCMLRKETPVYPVWLKSSKSMIFDISKVTEAGLEASLAGLDKLTKETDIEARITFLNRFAELMPRNFKEALEPHTKKILGAAMQVCTALNSSVPTTSSSSSSSNANASAPANNKELDDLLALVGIVNHSV